MTWDPVRRVRWRAIIEAEVADRHGAKPTDTAQDLVLRARRSVRPRRVVFVRSMSVPSDTQAIVSNLVAGLIKVV